MSVLIGMLVDEPEKVMTFGFTLVFPLTFTSSAFARADTMPVLWSLGWAALIAAVFFPLAVRAYRTRT